MLYIIKEICFVYERVEILKGETEQGSRGCVFRRKKSGPTNEILTRNKQKLQPLEPLNFCNLIFCGKRK